MMLVLKEKQLSEIFRNKNDFFFEIFLFLLKSLSVNLLINLSDFVSVFLQSIQYIHAFLKSRKYADREFYLLDISYWRDDARADVKTSLENAKKDLAAVTVDIDDDIYWFTYLGMSNSTRRSSLEIGLAENLTELQNSSVEMWEIYRIHRSTPLSVLQFATFSRSTGLTMVTADKWQRRRDLMVKNVELWFLNWTVKVCFLRTIC